VSHVPTSIVHAWKLKLKKKVEFILEIKFLLNSFLKLKRKYFVVEFILEIKKESILLLNSFLKLS
jgi:hypothetical protein